MKIELTFYVIETEKMTIFQFFLPAEKLIKVKKFIMRIRKFL